METVVLTAPEIIPQVVTPDYRFRSLFIDIEVPIIVIRLRGTNGEIKEFIYTGEEARLTIIALNKANLSVKSLQRRIMEKLINDGKIAGVINGVPD